MINDVSWHGTDSNKFLSVQTRNVGSIPTALDNMGNVAQLVERRITKRCFAKSTCSNFNVLHGVPYVVGSSPIIPHNFHTHTAIKESDLKPEHIIRVWFI